jgi:hypothetical protein
LGDGKMGRFEISPMQQEINSKQFYCLDIDVLVTRFFSPSGVAELEDFGAPLVARRAVHPAPPVSLQDNILYCPSSEK